MNDNKFVWVKDVLWYADHLRVAGWVGYNPKGQCWYARSAGTLEHPTVRAEFDNRDAAEDFLMFIAHTENP